MQGVRTQAVLLVRAADRHVLEMWGAAQVTARHLAAVYTVAMSGVVLASVVVQAAQGDLLVVKAGRIGWFTAVLLITWLAASIYAAWPAARDPRA